MKKKKGWLRVSLSSCIAEKEERDFRVRRWSNKLGLKGSQD